MTASHPNKKAVHDYMQRRIDQQHTKEHKPPPTPEQVREELGWNMIPENDKKPTT